MAKYPEKMLLKLPEGTLARIDGVGGNRSEWVRDVIEAALGGSPVEPVPGPVEVGVGRYPVEPVPVRRPGRPGEKLSEDGFPAHYAGDCRDVLERVSSGSWSSSALKRELGWLGVRYERAEGALMRMGLVRVEAGVLRCIGGVGVSG